MPFGHGLAFWDGLAHGRRRWVVVARDELRAHFAAQKDEGEGEARPEGRRALLRRRCAQGGCAESRCRCGGGEPSPGADVAGASPVPVQMWQGASPVPVQMWRG